MMRIRGFTLLEGLIAAGLLAIVGTALATSLSASVDSKEAVENISGRYHVVRQGMSRMVDELSMAYLSAHNVNNELRVQTGFRGESDEIHFTAFGGVHRIRDHKDSGQREISYLIGPDERTGEQSILRRIQPNPNDQFDEGGREQTLLPNVKDIEFQFWDPQSEDWKDSWNTEDSVYAGRLPTRIRIQVTAVMAYDEEQTFVTQTKVWLHRPWVFRN